MSQLPENNPVFIIGSGDDFSRDHIRHHLDKKGYVIAADGGLSILDSMKITPDCIIGDMDSIPAELASSYSTVKQISFQTDKDKTDSELALEYALDMAPSHIHLFAVTGSCFDHALANTALLVKYRKKGVPIVIHTANATLQLVSGMTSFKTEPHIQFSLFPLTECNGIELEGARWNFHAGTVGPMDYSVRNETTGSQLQVDTGSGFGLLILYNRPVRFA
jgi:thiamine pyrophosphokinase